MIERWRGYLSALSARQWMLVGSFLLCALCGVYLLQPDTSAPAVIVQHADITPPPSLEIAGLSAAAKRTALRNPFSAAHERIGETPPAAIPIDPKENIPQPHRVHEQAPIVPVVPAAPVPPPAPLILCGVVTSADGTRLAILAQGADGAALGIGEEWRGHTLRSITDRSATLDTVSGPITLTRE